MSSQRFPGKVLHAVSGKPVLGYLLERLRQCREIAHIVVASSDDSSDDAIARYCREHGVACFRGALDDVAARFAAVLVRYRFDGFVRVCADSPLLDHHLVDRAVRIFRHDACDVVTNVMRRTYPRGQSVEVVNADVFLAARADFTDADDREHVTRFFYRNPERFTIRSFSALMDLSDIRLCVDTPDDMRQFAALVSAMKQPHWSYSLTEIIALYHQALTGIREVA